VLTNWLCNLQLKIPLPHTPPSLSIFTCLWDQNLTCDGLIVIIDYWPPSRHWVFVKQMWNHKWGKPYKSFYPNPRWVSECLNTTRSFVTSGLKSPSLSLSLPCQKLSRPKFDSWWPHCDKRLLAFHLAHVFSFVGQTDFDFNLGLLYKTFFTVTV